MYAEILAGNNLFIITLSVAYLKNSKISRKLALKVILREFKIILN